MSTVEIQIHVYQDDDRLIHAGSSPDNDRLVRVTTDLDGEILEVIGRYEGDDWFALNQDPEDEGATALDVVRFYITEGFSENRA